MQSGVLIFTCDQTQCPAHDTCALVPTQLRVIKGSDNQEEVILFIGDAPGRNEAQDSVPFQGKDGDLLRKTIRKLNIRDLSVAYASLARYWPRDENGEKCEPDAAAVEACEKHLLADIKELKPSKIVILGSTALKLLLPDSPGIQKARGQHFTHPTLGKLFVTYHPSFVLRRQGLFHQWEADLQLMLGSSQVLAKAGKWSQPYTWRILEKIEDVEEYVEYLLTDKSIKVLALDTETRNVNKRYDNMLGTFQFCEDGKRGTVIPYNHPGFAWWPDDMKRLNAALVRLFTTPDPPFRYWLMHNVGFDYRMIFNFALGITQFNRPLLDTASMAYSQDENRGKSGINRPYSLDSLCRDYLKVAKYEDPDIERMKKLGKMLEIDIERLAKYGASDAVYTWRLFFYIRDRADKEGYKQQLMDLNEFWFAPVNRMNSIMSSNGFWVDVEQLRKLRNEKTSPITKRLAEIKAEWPKSDAAIEANNRLLRAKLGGKMVPLFGGSDAWEFDIDKQEHKRCLFFDVMELDPIDFGKGVRTPIVSKEQLGQEVRPIPVGKLDKAFQLRYLDIPEVERLNEHSGLKKLATSYVKSISEFLNPRNGMEGSRDNRVRPNFWVTTTDTGRSSSTDPNLQQVPRADNWAKKEIKNMYAAEPGCALIQLDFMTSEVRWWGILAQCQDLAKAFFNGKQARDDYYNKSIAYNNTHKMRYGVVEAAVSMFNDDFEMKSSADIKAMAGKFSTKALKIAYKYMKKDPEFFEMVKAKVWAGVAGDLHKNTASQMYDVPLLQVTKAQRNDTKAIVFGTMFGRGAKAIAQQLKIDDINDVIQRIRNFFDQFPDAEKWMYAQEELGEKRGYVESPLGRRRRLLTFIMGFGDDGEIARAKRIARNAPIQGISSDGAFLGAAMFCDWLIENDKWHVHPDKSCWLIQDVVHDSMVMQVPIEDVPEALRIVQPFFSNLLMERMTKIWDVNFNIPLEVDFEVGLKWGELQPWDATPLHLDHLMNSLRKQEAERTQEAA